MIIDHWQTEKKHIIEIKWKKFFPRKEIIKSPLPRPLFLLTRTSLSKTSMYLFQSCFSSYLINRCSAKIQIPTSAIFPKKPALPPFINKKAPLVRASPIKSSLITSPPFFTVITDFSHLISQPRTMIPPSSIVSQSLEGILRWLECLRCVEIYRRNGK